MEATWAVQSVEINPFIQDRGAQHDTRIDLLIKFLPSARLKLIESIHLQQMEKIERNYDQNKFV